MLDSLTMMALGAFRFALSASGYQNFAREAQYRWEPQDRVGRAPAMQFLGAGSDQITVDGVIYPQFAGGLYQVNLMRATAGLGRPLLLVDGLGWCWKRWVITAVTERRSVFMANGAPLKVEFSMTLQAYGEDAA